MTFPGGHRRRCSSRRGSRARWASRIAGAALLGAATILVPKADPTDHWAKPVDVVDMIKADQAADPDEPLAGGARLLWPEAFRSA